MASVSTGCSAAALARFDKRGDTRRCRANAHVLPMSTSAAEACAFRSYGSDEIVRTDEAIARRNNFQDDALRALPWVSTWRTGAETQVLAVRISSQVSK